MSSFKFVWYWRIVPSNFSINLNKPDKNIAFIPVYCTILVCVCIIIIIIVRAEPGESRDINTALFSVHAREGVFANYLR